MEKECLSDKILRKEKQKKTFSLSFSYLYSFSFLPFWFASLGSWSFCKQDYL